MTPKRRLKLEKKLKELQNIEYESSEFNAMFAKTLASSVTFFPIALISILSFFGVSVAIIISKYRSYFIMGVILIALLLIYIQIHKIVIRPRLIANKINRIKRKLENAP